MWFLSLLYFLMCLMTLLYLDLKLCPQSEHTKVLSPLRLERPAVWPVDAMLLKMTGRAWEEMRTRFEMKFLLKTK